MKLHVVAVGKLREAYFKAACDEYAGRIRHFVAFDDCEVPSATADSGNGSGNGALFTEADSILKQIPRGSKVIALEVKGKQLTSEQLSDFLQAEMLAGTGRLSFVIGGAWGLAPSLLESAALRLSLSPMTLPHELARVLLYEQLYRSLTLWKGLPYHK